MCAQPMRNAFIWADRCVCPVLVSGVLGAHSGGAPAKREDLYHNPCAFASFQSASISARVISRKERPEAFAPSST